MPSTRRSFLAGTSALALASRSLLGAADLNKRVLFVGTETGGKSTSKGIYAFAFDMITGSLEPMGLAASTTAPTFLAFSRGRVLYAVNESGLPDEHGKPGPGGMVSSYSVTLGAEHRLVPLNQVSAGGAGPVYISLSDGPVGRCAFVANYAGGSIASYRISVTGRLSEPVSTFTYPSPPDAPNKHSHAHRVTPAGAFLLVNDLGLDRIYVYALDATTATLTPHGEWVSGPGDGPRALRFHPNGKIAYCVNETQPTLHVLSWNPAAAAGRQLTTIQTVRLAETADQCHPGDIVLDRTASHAYVSTRRDNTVAICSVAEDGRLNQIGKIGSGGVRPRDLTLDPTGNWLLVANQDSNNISVFQRDSKTGSLSDPKISVALDQPMCLVFPS